MEQSVDVKKLPRYCVVCGGEYGSGLETHCTDRSLVAIKRVGLFKKETLYFTLDGKALSEDDLSRMREAETARKATWKQEQREELERRAKPASHEPTLTASQSALPIVSRPAASLPWNKVWMRALTRPSVDTFEGLLQDPGAAFWRALLWLFVTGLVGTAITILSTELVEFSERLRALPISVIDAVLMVLWVVSSAGIAQAIARALGGRGAYGVLLYAVAAYIAPLALIIGVLRAIPYVDLLISPLEIYGLVLSVVAVKAVHRFGWGKAIASSVFGVVCPFAVLTILTLLGHPLNAIIYDGLGLDTLTRPLEVEAIRDAPDDAGEYPTPALQGLQQRIEHMHGEIILIQVNAELLSEIARRVQAGKLSGPEESSFIVNLTELVRATDDHVPQVAPPGPLSSAWKDAVAIHEQVKDIFARWMDEDILSPQVVEEMKPVLEDIEAIALEAEQIMESEYDLDQKGLTKKRHEVLESVIVEAFEVAPPPKDIYLDQTPAWSPDGSRIAFTSDRHDPHPRDCNVYVMDADGSKVRRLTWDPADERIDHASPAWSPDGKRIAFASDRASRPGDYDIYVMNADGSNIIQLTDAPSTEWVPVWSPDGSQIVFISRDDTSGSDAVFDIYVMDADGSNVTWLIDGPAQDPAWSPDGRRIAFSSSRDGGRLHIYVMDADGSNVTRLAEGRHPTWSPDGNRIAFSSERDGNIDVYVMDADGSNVARLTDDPSDEYDPAWSPDGSRIAFTSDRDGDKADIYVMDADGSNVTRLTPVVPD